MIRGAAALAGVALMMSATLADAQPSRGGSRLAAGNPSAIVSAELAFARLAQQKGQWTAFRETADKDAVIFMPDAVNAKTWLKKRADPPRAVAWQPYRVFISCDGSYGLSTGPWTSPDGKSGTFSTIWRRDPKKGSYKWIVDFGSPTSIARQEEVIIEGKIGQCPARRTGPAEGIDGRPPMGERGDGRRRKQQVAAIPNPPPLSGQGQSDDGSLRWAWTKGDNGNRFVVIMSTASGDQTVLDETAPDRPQ